MKCLDCEGKARVTVSVELDGVVFRRRKCALCGKIFYTEESTAIRHTELREKFWKVCRGEDI